MISGAFIFRISAPGQIHHCAGRIAKLGHCNWGNSVAARLDVTAPLLIFVNEIRHKATFFDRHQNA